MVEIGKKLIIKNFLMITVHGFNSNTSSTNWRSAAESVPRAHRHFLPGKQKNGKQLVFEQNREIENKNRNKMRNGTGKNCFGQSLSRACLTTELLSEIKKHLLDKTLANLRCVGRQWYKG